jgi:hypothetical protein
MLVCFTFLTSVINSNFYKQLVLLEVYFCTDVGGFAPMIDLDKKIGVLLQFGLKKIESLFSFLSEHICGQLSKQ